MYTGNLSMVELSLETRVKFGQVMTYSESTTVTKVDRVPLSWSLPNADQRLSWAQELINLKLETIYPGISQPNHSTLQLQNNKP